MLVAVLQPHTALTTQFVWCLVSPVPANGSVPAVLHGLKAHIPGVEQGTACMHDHMVSGVVGPDCGVGCVEFVIGGWMTTCMPM